MKTRITELFGIEHPIICDGMLWVTDAKLCAAISEAGGLGCITADQYTSGDALREAIREVKALTDKPFGVNITLMKSFRITAETFMDFFRVCAEEKVANIEVSGLFATDFIPMLHAAGVKITHKVGAVRHAMKIERLGYDAVIVAGVEEGGHPLGCTGAYLTIKLLGELRRRGQKRGLVSMCIGGGMGAAGIVELI